MVKTIIHLPGDFAHGVQITVNDREFEVVARNVILLLYALTSLDEGQHFEAIAEDLIHIWYSAFLPAKLVASIQSKVGGLISLVCTEMNNKAAAIVHPEIWTFGPGRKVRLRIQRQRWLQLLQVVQAPKQMSFDEAIKIRSATVLAPERQDYRDRWYYKDATPSMRLAKQRYREDGLLLPFGHSRDEFDTPNP